jgi:small subunit ribosomal protein S4
LCRREGIKLYPKGERCYTPKCALERRKNPPGQHGLSRKKLTQYAIQLREKQKLKRIYGLSEKQFKLTFGKAEKMKGVVGENFLAMLERRLDNTLYRLGIASSRNQARQFVSHGHVMVNGRRVDIPSYIMRPGEEITLKEKSREIPHVKECVERAKSRLVPQWIELDLEKLKGKILSVPKPEDYTDIEVNEQLVVEYYSR